MPDPTNAPPSTPDVNRPPLWEALGIGVGFLIVAGALFGLSRMANAPGNAGYTGDASCRACHPGQAAAHVRSGHAQTLRRAAKSPAARKLPGLTVADPETPAVQWTYSDEHGELTALRRADGAVERFVLDYAFGSGRHATTFVGLTNRDPRNPAMIEHRLTVFAHQDLPGLTPGQSAAAHASGNTPAGRRFGSWETRKCFECHTTALSSSGTDALDVSTMIPNITCERCHGPGRDHIDAARAGAVGERLAMPSGTGREPAFSQIQACGICHRLPEMVLGGGGKISTEVATLVRHQPVGLLQSSCYLHSPGALSCTTCHDPHARTSKDTVAYETVCRSCHEGNGKTPCKTANTSGCVACHMPTRDVGQGMMMVDHWIRILKPNDAQSEAVQAR